MMLVMTLVSCGMFGQKAVEAIVDIFGSFAAGIIIGVVFIGGVKTSEHIRNRNRRREILMMPALEIEKSIGVLLFYIPVLPLVVFVGLKAGVLAFKGILRLMSYAIGDMDVLFALQARVSAGAAEMSSAGVSGAWVEGILGFMMLALLSTSALFAGMYFRKGYRPLAGILCLLEMISFPVAVVLLNDGLVESVHTMMVLTSGVSVSWCILNLYLSYRIFCNAEIAEHGLVRKILRAGH